MTGVLALVTKGDLSETSEAYARQIIDKKRGQTVTVVYRVANATNDTGAMLKDAFGRPIAETTGIVLPEEILSSTIPAYMLDRALDAFRESIQRFRRADTEFPVLKAAPLEWPRGAESGPSYRLVNLDPYKLGQPDPPNQLQAAVVESKPAKDVQQNLLLRLFKQLWNWLTNQGNHDPRP